MEIFLRVISCIDTFIILRRATEENWNDQRSTPSFVVGWIIKFNLERLKNSLLSSNIAIKRVSHNEWLSWKEVDFVIILYLVAMMTKMKSSFSRTMNVLKIFSWKTSSTELQIFCENYWERDKYYDIWKMFFMWQH